MTNFFFLLSLVLVVTSSLKAQMADETYSIGTPNNPVVAAEYCTFLTDSMAPQNAFSLNDVQTTFIGDAIPISITEDPSTTGNSCSYSFLLPLNQTNQPVLAVPTQEAQTDFNEWRINPLSKELLGYLNDQIHIFWRTASPGAISNYQADAALIKARYPNAKIFSQADAIASSFVRSSTYCFINERGVVVAVVPGNQMLALGPAMNEFANDEHRPVSILQQ